MEIPSLDEKRIIEMRLHLFHGELSDAPGRNEIWDNYLRYRGNGRWELITEATDFSGEAVLPISKELMSTRDLLHWVIERDDELLYPHATIVASPDELSEDDPPRVLGPHTQRLREIALAVRADYCVSCIDRWLNGMWPPKPQIKILKVHGVTRRGIWIRIFHCVYEVETTLGMAYMYPPDANGFAKLILMTEGSMSAGRQVKLSPAITGQLEIFRSVLERLNVD